MENHDYKFEGGEYLTSMSASWFTSFFYYYYVDRNHNNWRKKKGYTQLFWETVEYHLFWLSKIVDMNDNKLGTNKIGLLGKEVKEMALKSMEKYIFLKNNNMINEKGYIIYK